ncbi:hypothetical protein KIW84_030176 [Lathyrus oleraceus]|uniref:F-box domain-containing protein n=1 Tax=Pisum sativum TaxID=3888 RepID=A0A9D4XNY3_PEA|nr:hypothetical protein KIW84_030176 [Pisum sativum]
MSDTSLTPNVTGNINLKKVKMFDHISQLPDCILSYILTKLSMKDLLKTSILSKRWCNLWALRRDLYFDIFNVFENNEEELLQKRNSKKFIEQFSQDCLKLTSLDYNGHDLANLNFNTPMLNNFHLAVSYSQHLIAFRLFATLPKLEILQLDIYSTVSTSLKITQRLEHLKQLNLILMRPFDFLQKLEFGLSGILTILQASPLLQKLSVMKDARDLEAFSHDEVKVIELRGCVGNWYEIEFAMNVMKYANKLERIVLTPYWRDDIDESLDWNFNPAWFQNGRQRIAEKLQNEEVVGREKLVLI